MAVLDSTDLQYLARERYDVSGKVIHVAPTGNDANDGFSFKPNSPLLTLGAALAAAVNGDLVLASTGVFAMGGGVANFPDGVSFVGAGIDLTTVTSTADVGVTGCIVKPGSNSLIADMTIKGIAAPGVLQALLGTNALSTGQTPFVNATFRRLRLVADALGLFIGTANSDCSAAGWDLQIKTKGDGVTLAASAASTLDLYNPTIDVTGPSSNAAGATSRGIASSAGFVRAFGGTVAVTGATTTNHGVDISFNGQGRLVLTKMLTTGVGAVDLVNTGLGLVVQDVAYLASVGAAARNTPEPLELDLLTSATRPAGSYGALLRALANTGVGAWPVKVVVTDGVNPIAGASVRVGVAQWAVNVSNGSGIAALTLDPGSVTVQISAPGYYAFNPLAEVISSTGKWLNGTDTVTVSLTAAPVASAPAAGYTNVSGYVYGPNQQPAPNAVVNYRLVKTTAPNVYSGLSNTVTADSMGFFQVQVLQNSETEFWFGSGEHLSVITGTAAQASLPGPLFGDFTP